jgi:hypothetical protein
MEPGYIDRASGTNRRRFMRVHPSVLATRVATRDVSQIGILVENIGLGGAYLRTDKPLPVGEPLDLELARPGHQALVRLHGRVVSAVKQDRALEMDKPPGMGVSFGTLDERTRESLRELIRSFVPEGMSLELKRTPAIKVTAARPEPVSTLSQDLPGPIPMPPPSVPRRDETAFPLSRSNAVWRTGASDISPLTRPGVRCPRPRPPQVRSATTAVASISTSAAGSTSPVTTTTAIAGK